MTRKKQHQPAQTPPDGPAIVRPNHAQVRKISAVAGAQKGWSDLTSLERAFHKQQLVGGSEKYSAMMRQEAGLEYAANFLMANGGGGRDSTQSLGGFRSTGGFSPPKSQQEAIAVVVGVESYMGARDKLIIQRVCGHGNEPGVVIKAISADYKFTAPGRFREALDALIEAFDRHRRDEHAKKMAS